MCTVSSLPTIPYSLQKYILLHPFQSVTSARQWQNFASGSRLDEALWMKPRTWTSSKKIIQNEAPHPSENLQSPEPSWTYKPESWYPSHSSSLRCLESGLPGRRFQCIFGTRGYLRVRLRQAALGCGRAVRATAHAGSGELRWVELAVDPCNRVNALCWFMCYFLGQGTVGILSKFGPDAALDHAHDFDFFFYFLFFTQIKGDLFCTKKQNKQNRHKSIPPGPAGLVDT